jgi:Uma2 family endonuclease
MKPETIPPETQDIAYPDSDGQPMADNTRQFRLIVTIQGNLDALFADREDVFVAGDLLWYARQGDPTERLAPDVMVVFGRPRGECGSYKQWEEGGIAPQVVWEVLSPGNTTTEMAEKRDFYQRHGVQEYYEYDPDRGLLRGWLRSGETLDSITEMQGHRSPLLDVRMELDELDDLVLYRPDGARFLSFLQLDEKFRETRETLRRERLEREEAERQAQETLRRERLGRDEAERQAQEAQRQMGEAQETLQRERLEREQAECQAREKQKALQREREEAAQRADQAEAGARAAQNQVALLAARLRALGIDPDQP